VERHPAPALNRSPVGAVLRLVRAPNLGTAVADVVAGAALAGAPIADLRTLVPALGSAALYAGGVALNDAFDVEKDKRLHPDRVLPSGALGVSTARVIGVLLLLVGVASGLAAGPLGLAVAAAVAVCILIYDLVPDSPAAWGVAALAACRGLNLLRGAATGPDAIGEVLPFAIVHAALVAALTVISLGEDRVMPRAVAWSARALPFLYAGPVVAAFQRGDGLRALLLLVAAAELGLWVVRPAFRTPPAPNLVVPRGVFTITLVGALYAAACGADRAAVVLAGLFVASRLLARALAQRGS
jgi:hypothetical protein